MCVRVRWAEAQFEERFDAVPSSRATERSVYRMLAAESLYCERCGGGLDVAWELDGVEMCCGNWMSWGGGRG